MQGAIGILRKLLRIGAVIGIEGDAHRDRQEDLVAINLERSLEGVNNPVEQGAKAVCIRKRAADPNDTKLVTAKPGHEIARRDA